MKQHKQRIHRKILPLADDRAHQMTDSVPQTDDVFAAARHIRTASNGQLRPDHILALQRTIGNQAVSRALKQPHPVIQANTGGTAIIQRVLGPALKEDTIVVSTASGKKYRVAQAKLALEKWQYRLELMPEAAPPQVQMPVPVALPDVAALPQMSSSPATQPSSAAPTLPPNMKPAPVFKAPAPLKIVKKTPSAQPPPNARPVGKLNVKSLGDVRPAQAEQEKTFELWVPEDTLEYTTEDKYQDELAKRREIEERERKAQEVESKRIGLESAASNLYGLLGPTEKVYKVGKDYDFGWWFNYFWSEARVAPYLFRLGVKGWAIKHQGGQLPSENKALLKDIKEDIALEITKYATQFDGLGQREILEELLKVGFLAKSEADFKDVKDLEEGPQGKDTEYHQVRLPSLKQTGLVYRSDSRKPEMIKQHGGSKPRSALPKQELRKVNLDAPWNPFSDSDRLKKLWLRLGMVDNDLNTVVSLAVDPREAVKFPLPGSTRSDGSLVSGGRDEAHLYVIWIKDKQVIDTSAEITRTTGASRFGRGELGALDVPYDTHLVHIITERYFEDNNVSYVAGKVKKVELIQPDSVYLALPQATRQGLFEVVRAVNGGDLRWLVHKPGKEDEQPPKVRDIEQKVATDQSVPIGQHNTELRVKILEAKIKDPSITGLEVAQTELAGQLIPYLVKGNSFATLASVKRGATAEAYQDFVRIIGKYKELIKGADLKQARKNQAGINDWLVRNSETLKGIEVRAKGDAQTREIITACRDVTQWMMLHIELLKDSTLFASSPAREQAATGSKAH